MGNIQSECVQVAPLMLTVRIKAIDFFEGGFQMAFLYTKQILLFLVFTVRPATEQGLFTIITGILTV